MAIRPLRPVASGGDPAFALPVALAGLGEALRARPIGPDPDFRAALRARVVAVATVAPHQEAAAREAKRTRRVDLRVRVARASIAGIAASVAVAGVSVATSRSLPGDPLYGAKRATESFQLAFAGSDLDRGLLHLELARTRLGEVKDLVARDDSALPYQLAAGSPLSGTGVPQGLSPHTAKLVASTLAAMDHETRLGAELVTTSYLRQRKAAPIAKLQTFLADQSAGLTAVIPALPSSALPQANASLQLLNAVNAQANALLDTAPPVVPLPAPRPIVIPTPRSDGPGSVVVVPSNGPNAQNGGGRPTDAPATGAPVVPPSSAVPPSAAPSGDTSSGSEAPSPSAEPSTAGSPSPSDSSSPSPSSAPPTSKPAPSPSASPSSHGILPWPFGTSST
ncbi:MAG TPA: DUF5667 domain-containing protein [Mycobacteriales bacterium]|nr:DUF5667 domain-containing protein [Mycobacteriales bacterium]